jgi:protoheme ferro-lyase
MKRIYHPYWLWEDYKAGFYDNVSGDQKQILLKKVVEMFNSKSLTKENMLRVINEWIYSCEHNLTNDSLNKIAYIGQGACCLYAGVPSTITMEAWSLLTNEVKERSNKIALDVINQWESNNKFIQLCLKLD